MFSGYIHKVEFGESVNLSQLASLCGVDRQAYQSELDVSIADVLSMAEHLYGDGEIVFYNNIRLQELLNISDPPEWSEIPARPLTAEEEAELDELAFGQEDCRFNLYIEIDHKVKAVSLRFVNESNGKELHKIENTFENIARALAPYRKAVKEYGFTSFAESRAEIIAREGFRAETHFDILRRINLCEQRDCMIGFDLAKKIGSLFCALFPKGPRDDWDWSSPPAKVA